MADRIPPELFEKMLVSLTGPFVKSTINLNGEVKHVLSRWSLTCRYWAKHCRPYLFRRLALRSREDAMAFCQIIRSTVDGTPVGTHVRELMLHMKWSDPPWVQLIWLSTSATVVPSLWFIGANISSAVSLETRSSTRHALHFGTPKSYPTSSIRARRYVHWVIQGLHLEAFRDVIAIVTSTGADHLTFNRMLRWADTDTLTPTSAISSVLSKPRRRIRLNMVRIINCTPEWPFLLLFLTIRPGATLMRGIETRPVFVSAATAPTLLAIAIVLLDDYSSQVRSHSTERKYVATSQIKSNTSEHRCQDAHPMS